MAVAYVGVFSTAFDASPTSPNVFAFTANATNTGDIIVVNVYMVPGNGPDTPSAVALTASGWTFTQIGSILAGTLVGVYTATFAAIVPNTSSTAFTVTWTVSGGAANNIYFGVLGDEFSGNANTVASAIDAYNSTYVINIATNPSISVTPVNNNDAIWAVEWIDTVPVSSIGPGYSAGATDGGGDDAEYKILSGQAGISQAATWVSGGTSGYALWIVAITSVTAPSVIAGNRVPVFFLG